METRVLFVAGTKILKYNLDETGFIMNILSIFLNMANSDNGLPPYWG
jgi:hypothetical protein